MAIFTSVELIAHLVWIVSLRVVLQVAVGELGLLRRRHASVRVLLGARPAQQNLVEAMHLRQRHLQQEALHHQLLHVLAQTWSAEKTPIVWECRHFSATVWRTGRSGDTDPAGGYSAAPCRRQFDRCSSCSIRASNKGPASTTHHTQICISTTARISA